MKRKYTKRVSQSLSRQYASTHAGESRSQSQFCYTHKNYIIPFRKYKEWYNHAIRDRRGANIKLKCIITTLLQDLFIFYCMGYHCFQRRFLKIAGGLFVHLFAPSKQDAHASYWKHETKTRHLVDIPLKYYNCCIFFKYLSFIDSLLRFAWPPLNIILCSTILFGSGRK